ncbi:QRFP-like peptide receptor [Oculina patagonica]
MSANVNTTTNGTQLSSCFNPTALKLGETFAYCLIFVVSLAGNIFIAVIVYTTKTMRKPINFFIVNMAMSDLLYPIFLIPRRLTELYIDSWLISGPLGQALCKLSFFLPNVSSAVSVQSLVLIAVDRFGAVVFPLRSPLIISKLCLFFVLATWIVAMGINSPDLFTFKLVEYRGGLVCSLQWIEVFGESSSIVDYMLAIFVAFIYTPLVLIAILYIITYLKLKSEKIPGEQSDNTRQQRMKRERNVLKMAIAIVLGFAVCWLPTSICWILILFVPDIFIWSCGFRYFFIVVKFLPYANCAINPCICFIFSGNYRQALKNLFRCFRGNSRRSHSELAYLFFQFFDFN